MPLHFYDITAEPHKWLLGAQTGFGWTDWQPHESDIGLTGIYGKFNKQCMHFPSRPEFDQEKCRCYCPF
jgi:hypothetical protein